MSTSFYLHNLNLFSVYLSSHFFNDIYYSNVALGGLFVFFLGGLV